MTSCVVPATQQEPLRRLVSFRCYPPTRNQIYNANRLLGVEMLTVSSCMAADVPRDSVVLFPGEFSPLGMFSSFRMGLSELSLTRSIDSSNPDSNTVTTPYFSLPSRRRMTAEALYARLVFPQFKVQSSCAPKTSLLRHQGRHLNGNTPRACR